MVPIAAFDTSAFIKMTCSGSGCVAGVVNLIGFFVEGMCDQVFATTPAWCGSALEAQRVGVGRLMKYPGQGVGPGAPVTSSFVPQVRLVR